MPIGSMEDLKSSLKGHAAENDVLEFVVGQIEKEKTTGIDSRRKANREAEGLREKLKKVQASLTELGYPEEEDADLEGFLEGLKTKVKSSTQSESETQKAVKKLQNQLKTLETQLAEKTKAEQDLRLKATVSRIKEALTKSLGDKIYGPGFVIDSLIASGAVALDDAEQVVWKNGDQSVPYETGLKTWIDKNPDVVKNQQKAGSASAAAQGPAQRKFTIEQMQGMSKDDIKANLKDIKQSLGIT